MPADEYRSFAGDYHWFFDDVALRLGSDVPGVRNAIAALPPGSRVLDAACGIGVDVRWLHRHGHVVVGADASPAMVDEARRRSNQASGEPEIALCAWADLSDRFAPAGFDMVLCTGSAIAHAACADEMITALAAFRAMLAPSGVLVVDSHDWEVVFAGGSRTTVDPVVVERGGERCVRTFSWHLPERFGDVAVFEPGLIFVDGRRASIRSYPVRMWPFTRTELRQRLRRSGFESVGLDLMPGDDRYTAVAATQS